MKRGTIYLDHQVPHLKKTPSQHQRSQTFPKEGKITGKKILMFIVY